MLSILWVMFTGVMGFADAFVELTHGFGPLGVALFLAVLIAVVLLFVPITPFSLAAGAIYGWWGVPIAFTGAILGSMLAFGIARGIGQPHIRRLCRKRPIVRAIERVMVKGGFRLVLLIRLSGALPFSLQNYAFGLSAVDWRAFLAASLIGLVPGAVIKVWIGKVGMDVLHGDMLVSRIQSVSLIVAIVLTLVMIAYIGTLAYRELKFVGVIEVKPLQNG